MGNKVRHTQRAIKHALTERWYAWEEARKVAKNDPEVDLEANVLNGEPAYRPMILEVSDYSRACVISADFAQDDSSPFEVEEQSKPAVGAAT